MPEETKTDEQLIDAAMPAEGEFIPFEGQNCDEVCWMNDDGEDPPSCRGWNGRDRRCDCGNRRVYWDTDLVPGMAVAVAD